MRHPIGLLISLLLLAITTTVAVAAATAIVVLYDGSLNTGTPDTQGLEYLTNPFSGALATQTFTNGVTTLDTTPRLSDYAGYFAKTTLYPPLDRVAGYQLSFTTQMLTETHSSADRAVVQRLGDQMISQGNLQITYRLL